MKLSKLPIALVCSLVASTFCLKASDWPQWRGPNRDGKTPSFDAPKSWPTELNKQWSVAVGSGDATPALVGDKLFVFAREGGNNGNEVIRCLNASTGEELWQDEYPALAPTGGASRHPGPRSSPTVADGKVITFGARGKLSCYEAASGKKLWQKDTGEAPRFFTSSSPIIDGDLVITQVGDERNGGIAAYDLNNGAEKWRWSGDGPAYASPVLFRAGTLKAIIAMTNSKLVALGVSDGELLWEMDYAVPQGQRGAYNASSPTLSGSTLVFSGSGRGTKAVKLQARGDKVSASPLWSNEVQSAGFNSPIVKDGLVFGLTQGNELFCLNAEGETAWTAPAAGAPAQNENAENRGDRGGQGGRRGGRGGRGGGGGYGSLIDAGSVLLALTPSAELIAFEPTADSFKELARIKVADGGTYAHPIPVDNRIFVKDAEAVTLWTLN